MTNKDPSGHDSLDTLFNFLQSGPQTIPVFKNTRINSIQVALL